MAQTRNLCAQLPLDLHAKVCEAREQSGLTTAQYITSLLTEYYAMKENGGKERYIGDALLQKTYTTDCISKKIVRNTGNCLSLPVMELTPLTL